MSTTKDSYALAYGHYATDVLAKVRRDSFDEDIGQNSWLTAAELRTFLEWLDLGADDHVLEVACGSGGPACYVAQTTGCRLTGIDNTAEGVANARAIAKQQGLSDRTVFLEADANQRLPFDNAQFDALLCIDALNHLRDRRFVLNEWARVLRPRGRLTFTDPVVVTGAVSNRELALRSSIGFFLFVPPGYTERLLADVGLQVVHVADASEGAATSSAKRRAARERYREELVAIEGREGFDAFQAFLDVVHELSASRRLSRFVYHAVKSR